MRIENTRDARLVERAISKQCLTDEHWELLGNQILKALKKDGLKARAVTSLGRTMVAIRNQDHKEALSSGEYIPRAQALLAIERFIEDAMAVISDREVIQRLVDAYERRLGATDGA